MTAGSSVWFQLRAWWRQWRRLLREATGEAVWDDYLIACHARGEQPMSRRAFERLRSERLEANPQRRCC